MFVVCPVVLVVVVVERPSRSVSRDELVAAVVLTVSGGSFSFSFITFLDENSTIKIQNSKSIVAANQPILF